MLSESTVSPSHKIKIIFELLTEFYLWQTSLSSLIKTTDVHDAPNTEYIDVLDDVVPLRSGLTKSQDYFIVPGYGQMSKSRMENAVSEAHRRGERSSSSVKDVPVPVQTFYGKYNL